MGKGNKTLEEELDSEDNENEQDLDFGLYGQGSVGGQQQRFLENSLERKESLLPGLNKFTSVYTPLPIRREKSFQYLVDPSLGAVNSIQNQPYMQMEIPETYQDQQYAFDPELDIQKDEELKRQSSLFSMRNDNNEYYQYNDNIPQDNNDQDGAWVDVDDSNDNQEININKTSNSNQIGSSGSLNRVLNRGKSQLSKYNGLVANEDNNEDESDVQEIKPEQFITIESSKNLKSNIQLREQQIVEVSGEDNDEEEIEEIFSDDDGDQQQKQSNQSLKSIKVIDLETMEEEKRKKTRLIRKNSHISRDFIDLEEDQEKEENYKLTNAEEFGIVSNMNDWMNLSRNNMRLRLLNRKFQSELNRERSVQIQKSKSHSDIFDKMKKKMKKLITSNQQLAESNKETERSFKESLQQLQRVTSELIEKQKSLQDLHNKLTQSETTQIELQTLLENKENEVQNLRNSIQICEDTAARIQSKKSMFEHSDSQFNTNRALTNSVNMVEIQQKLDELNSVLGEKSLALSSNQDMFQIFCVLHRKLMNIKSENEKKDEEINQLQKFKAEKNNLELRARLAEDELDSTKKNNVLLSQSLSEKENSIQHLKLQVRNIEQFTEQNQRLQTEVNTLQQEKYDKERLLMEQEVIHQIKIDNILDSINNPQLKSAIKKQLEELMDINQISQAAYTPQDILPPLTSEIKSRYDSKRVKMNKKKSDVNEECLLLKNALAKLFNWEVKYVGTQPVSFNLVDKKNPNRKKLQVNLALNEEGEIEITNKQYLLKNVRKLWKMLSSDQHMPTLRSCVENFWLITALQLKDYFETEEKEFNKQMEIQSQNDLGQRGFVQQDIEDNDIISVSSESSIGQSDEELDQEDNAQNMDVSENQLSGNKLSVEDDGEENKIDEEANDQEIEIGEDEEEEGRQLSNEDDYSEQDEVVNQEESSNRNQNYNNYDKEDEQDDSELLKQLQEGNSERGEINSEERQSNGQFSNEDVSAQSFEGQDQQ